VPYDIYIESEKRPQITVDADRVEKAEGYVNFYKQSEMIASFKVEKVVGYVKMTMPM
jgi:hypothetical protein